MGDHTPCRDDLAPRSLWRAGANLRRPVTGRFTVRPRLVAGVRAEQAGARHAPFRQERPQRLDARKGLITGHSITLPRKPARANAPALRRRAPPFPKARAARNSAAMSIQNAKLDQVIDRFDQVEARLGAAANPDEIVKLSKEHAELKTVAEKARALKAARADLAEADAIIEDGSDRDMVALAEDERIALRKRLPALERELQLLLIPKDKDDDASIMLEIRAGTGGDEAALFAGDLFRMYERYAANRGWKVELVEASEAEVGGYKEIIASVTGAGVFGRLKFESGVHRVQRVPVTESGGRIHTSAATVAILPEPEDVDIVIRDEDIRIDTMRSSGAGGQHVNKTESAVRMTHLPTGIVVLSSEKSQHQNRAIAMQVLKARLYEKERSEKDAARAADRKGQVGSGDRSERIRSYNFPQGRVSDHRINLPLYKLAEILSGEALDGVIDALVSEAQAARLAAMEEA